MIFLQSPGVYCYSFFCIFRLTLKITVKCIICKKKKKKWRKQNSLAISVLWENDYQHIVIGSSSLFFYFHYHVSSINFLFWLSSFPVFSLTCVDLCHTFKQQFLGLSPEIEAPLDKSTWHLKNISKHKLTLNSFFLLEFSSLSILDSVLFVPHTLEWSPNTADSMSKISP